VLWRAKQVAAIPEAEFETMVESDNPPTVSRLVDYARCKRRSKLSTWERLVGAWNAATDEERVQPFERSGRLADAPAPESPVLTHRSPVAAFAARRVGDGPARELASWDFCGARGKYTGRGKFPWNFTSFRGI
jgi:hypothetical protein